MLTYFIKATLACVGFVAVVVVNAQRFEKSRAAWQRRDAAPRQLLVCTRDGAVIYMIICICYTHAV